MKRRGFTLIELMVVIAIIIILAAIAIPNYLKMTERAKRSRLASDMATMATVLETFKTDWGIYPIAESKQDVSDAAAPTNVFAELTGADHGDPGVNIADATNAVGETNPPTWSDTTPFISYIKAGTLTSIVNPFIPLNKVYYLSTSDGASGWAIYAEIADGKFLFRTSSTSTVSEADAEPSAPAD